jgi:ABC-type multidrug transport system fused ATPase/permease subunit
VTRSPPIWPSLAREGTVATLQDHERNRLHHPDKPTWLRVLVYARPYVGPILIAFALSFVASGADFARAYLMKPLLDDVILPHGPELASSEVQGWVSDFLPFGAEAGPDPASEAEVADTPAGDDAARDAALQAEVQDRLFFILLAAGLVVLILPLANFCREYVAAYALGLMNVDMKRDACAKLLALPLSFHHQSRRGDVYQRVVRDVSSAHSALGLLFSDLAPAVVRIGVGVGFLFFVSWQLSLMSLIIGPLVLGVISIFGRRIRTSARARQQQTAEVTQNLLEILSGIKIIKAFRAEASEDAAYRREMRKLFKRSIKVTKNRLLARGIVGLLNALLTYGALLVGIAAMGWWQISVGDIVAFFLISTQAYRPMRKLTRAWVAIMDAHAGAERFLEVMDTPVELRDAADAIEISPLEHGLAMRGVSFAYGDEPVLRDVSFEARAGEVVAVVGETGAGKTTLIDLLMRFYDPTDGSVEIDGIDLRRVTRDSLLGQIAVVTQEPFLFDGTVRENLRYGKPDATEEELRLAARAAHVDEFVGDLPDGYDTMVGAAGVRLSGGQRQRITIGRAILKDPAILILDEATSSLDSKSEKYVQEAIDALLGGKRTVFVIAHRLSTIRRAERILVIEDGTISQQGSHEELVEVDGLYRELVELQDAARHSSAAR